MALLNHDGSPASRPVPHPDHVEAAEKEARFRRAVNYIMTRDRIGYPEAAKKVDAEGADAIVSALDAPAPLTDAAVRDALKEKLTHSPGEMLEFLLALNDRVLALEGSPESSVPVDWGQPAIEGRAGQAERKAFTDSHTRGPKPFGQ